MRIQIVDEFQLSIWQLSEQLIHPILVLSITKIWCKNFEYKDTPTLFRLLMEISPKMQPLVTTRRLMTWLSMCPRADKSPNARPKKAYVVAHTFTVLSLNFIGFIAPIAFCLKYISIDFNGTTFAFMIIIAEFGVIYFLIIAILMRHHIDSVFTSLSAIYKSSKFNSVDISKSIIIIQ